jgi:hypothetical protein
MARYKCCLWVLEVISGFQKYLGPQNPAVDVYDHVSQRISFWRTNSWTSPSWMIGWPSSDPSGSPSCSHPQSGDPKARHRRLDVNLGISQSDRAPDNLRDLCSYLQLHGSSTSLKVISTYYPYGSIWPMNVNEVVRSPITSFILSRKRAVTSVTPAPPRCKLPTPRRASQERTWMPWDHGHL